MPRLSAPTSGTFLVALLLGGLGIAARLGYVPALAPHAFWLVAGGLALLVLGNLFRGL
jgi:hypothetical protein